MIYENFEQHELNMRCCCVCVFTYFKFVFSIRLYWKLFRYIEFDIKSQKSSFEKMSWIKLFILTIIFQLVTKKYQFSNNFGYIVKTGAYCVSTKSSDFIHVHHTCTHLRYLFNKIKFSEWKHGKIILNVLMV